MIFEGSAAKRAFGNCERLGHVWKKTSYNVLNTEQRNIFEGSPLSELSNDIIRILGKKYLMKSLLFALLVSPFLMTNGGIDTSIMEENSMAVSIDGGALQVLESEKAFVSKGENMSKISIKGTETTTQFKKGSDLVFYTRGRTRTEKMPLAIIKMEVGKKKRTAAYNVMSGKRFSSRPFFAKQIDANKMIYRVTPNSPLEVGVYCILFSRCSEGNLKMQPGLRLLNNQCFFEIIE